MALPSIIYRWLTSAVSPLLDAELYRRRFFGYSSASRLGERMGYPTAVRPRGALLWFHAVSVGESAACVPVVRECLLRRPDLLILFTFHDSSTMSILETALPQGVILQLAPFDTVAAVTRFLSHWRPQAVVVLESELWPNLLLSPALAHLPLALLNARMSPRSFQRWLGAATHPLAKAMLRKFCLITPMNSGEGVRFQLLGAPLSAIRFCGDLKYGRGGLHLGGCTEPGHLLQCTLSGAASMGDVSGDALPRLRTTIADRPVWVAGSTHEGEEEIIGRVQLRLLQTFPTLLLIIAPRHTSRGAALVQSLGLMGLTVAQRSQGHPLTSSTNLYLADTLGELRDMYSCASVAFVGGSLIPGLAGHNLAEAARASCAVITGQHVGHFSAMIDHLQSLSEGAIWQVGDEEELFQALYALYTTPEVLRARRVAAQEAASKAASGVVDKVWAAVDSCVLKRIGHMECDSHYGHQ